MENITLSAHEMSQFEEVKGDYSKMNTLEKIKLIFFSSISAVLMLRGIIFWGLIFALIALIHYLVVHKRCKKLSSTEVHNLTSIEGILNHRPVRSKNDLQNFSIKVKSDNQRYVGIYKKHKEFEGKKVRVFHHKNHIFVVTPIVEW